MMSAGIVMRIIFVWSGFTGCVSEDGSAAASIAPARSSEMTHIPDICHFFYTGKIFGE